jgi:glutaredoxin-like protein NrdH
VSDEVFIYALSTCPWCRKAKQYFADNDIPFEAVDIDLLPDEEGDRLADEALFASGSRAYPIVRIGTEVVVGYAPEKYGRLLGIGEQ